MANLKQKSNLVCAWGVVKALTFIVVLGVVLTWAMFGGG